MWLSGCIHFLGVHADQFFAGVAFHLGESGVDFYDIAIEVGDYEAVACGFEDGAILLLSHADAFFGLNAMGDIAEHSEGVELPVVHDGSYLDFDIEGCAVFADVDGFAVEALPRPDFFVVLSEEGQAVGMHIGGGVEFEHFFAGVAVHVAPCRVDFDDLGVEVGYGEAVGRRFEDCAVLLFFET